MTKHKLFFLLMLSFKAFSQSHEVSCSESPYFSFEAKNIKTHQYSPVFVAKKVYLSLKEVTNAFPEALIESEMSVTSQEWSSFNYGKKREAEPKRYALNQKADTAKNYAKLLYKIQYEVNGADYAIIKLHIHSDGKSEPMGFALSMKKQQNRWVIYDESAITDLMFLMIFLKTEMLDSIFNQQKTTNQVLNTLIDSSKENGVLSLNKLLFSVKTTLEKDKNRLESVLDPYRIFK